MRTFLLLSLLSTFAMAVELPGFSPKVRGAVIAGLGLRLPLEVLAGEPTDCKRKDLTDMIVYRCAMKNSTATVVDEKGTTQRFTFSAMSAFYGVNREGEPYRQFFFFGSWDDTKAVAKLTLMHWKKAPEKITGNLLIEDYQINQAIQATPVN